jgi:hypothetical protein
MSKKQQNDKTGESTEEEISPSQALCLENMKEDKLRRRAKKESDEKCAKLKGKKSSEKDKEFEIGLVNYIQVNENIWRLL